MEWILKYTLAQGKRERKERKEKITFSSLLLRNSSYTLAIFQSFFELIRSIVYQVTPGEQRHRRREREREEQREREKRREEKKKRQVTGDVEGENSPHFQLIICVKC